METPIHSLTSLFDQLGLDSSSEKIKDFIRSNKPLPDGTELSNAECWNAAQASFLKQVKDDDADWAEIADQLDAMLR
mgnify:CR=1 FL=1